MTQQGEMKERDLNSNWANEGGEVEAVGAGRR